MSTEGIYQKHIRDWSEDSISVNKMTDQSLYQIQIVDYRFFHCGMRIFMKITLP